VELILVAFGILAAIYLLGSPRRCSQCGGVIGHREAWPDGHDGTQCQDCWEIETGRLWSEMFDKETRHDAE